MSIVDFKFDISLSGRGCCSSHGWPPTKNQNFKRKRNPCTISTRPEKFLASFKRLALSATEEKSFAVILEKNLTFIADDAPLSGETHFWRTEGDSVLFPPTPATCAPSSRATGVPVVPGAPAARQWCAARPGRAGSGALPGGRPLRVCHCRSTHRQRTARTEMHRETPVHSLFSIAPGPRTSALKFAGG